MFVKRIKSLYRSHTSFQIVSQHSALCTIDPEFAHGNDTEDVANFMSETNPCHHDYPFAGVQFTSKQELQCMVHTLSGKHVITDERGFVYIVMSNKL